MYNPYLYEKLVQSRHQELLQEAEQRRMVAQLPRRHPLVLHNPARMLVAFLKGLSVSPKKARQPARMATGQL